MCLFGITSSLLLFLYHLITAIDNSSPMVIVTASKRKHQKPQLNILLFKVGMFKMKGININTPRAKNKLKILMNMPTNIPFIEYGMWEHKNSNIPIKSKISCRQSIVSSSENHLIRRLV